MLNKNGWGLQEMLILSGVLVLFLIVAIFFIYRLYADMGNEFNNDYYVSMEEDLERNALIYLEDYYNDTLTSDEVTIATEVLEQYDLGVILSDSMGRDCSGYVVASKSMGKTNVKGYISCSNYTTEGYEEWRDN